MAADEGGAGSSAFRLMIMLVYLNVACGKFIVSTAFAHSNSNTPINQTRTTMTTIMRNNSRTTEREQQPNYADQIPQEQRLALQIIIADPPPTQQKQTNHHHYHHYYHAQRNRSVNRSTTHKKRPYDIPDPSNSIERVLYLFDNDGGSAGGGGKNGPQLLLAKHKRKKRPPAQQLVHAPRRVMFNRKSEVLRTQHRPPLSWRHQTKTSESDGRRSGSTSSPLHYENIHDLDSNNQYDSFYTKASGSLGNAKNKLMRLTTTMSPTITATTEFFKLISSAHSPIKSLINSNNNNITLNRAQAQEILINSTARNGSVAAKSAATISDRIDSGYDGDITRVTSSTATLAPPAEQMGATSTALYPSTYAAASNTDHERNLASNYAAFTSTTLEPSDYTERRPDSTLDHQQFPQQQQQRPGAPDGRVISPAIMVRDGDSDELDSRRGISLIRAGGGNGYYNSSSSREPSNISAQQRQQQQQQQQQQQLANMNANNIGGGTVSFDDSLEADMLDSNGLQADDGRRMFNLTLNLQHQQNPMAPALSSPQYQIQVQPHQQTATTTTYFNSQDGAKRPIAIVHHVQRLPPTTPTPRPTIQLIGVPERIKVDGGEFPGAGYESDGADRVLMLTTSGTMNPPPVVTTTSAPQLVRLISKQKHKFDENVISPTLTVVDNAAIRLPPNATSVHNNKLIVAIRPGRPRRRHPPTTQFPVYNIVAGITPPYATSPSQIQYTRPPPIDGSVYGLLKPTPSAASGNNSSSSNHHGDQTTKAPATTNFGAQNIKFPALAPSSFQPEHVELLPDKFNVTVPDSANIVGPNKIPDKILVETNEDPMRPPADAVVLSDSTIVRRPHGSQTITNPDNLIIRLSTTRRPTRVSTTKRINIVSANTTVVTTNADQLHDVLSNVIAGSHQQDHIHHHNRPSSNRPGILSSIYNLLNAGVATTAITILTVVKTIFFALMVMFLPPIALTAALMQAINIG